MASQDDYSDIPKEVPPGDDEYVDPENVMRGHKATISNPHTSEKAKEHSRQVLSNEFEEPYDETATYQGSHPSQGEKDPGNVTRGLKAAVSNEGVSEDAKNRAKERLGE